MRIRLTEARIDVLRTVERSGGAHGSRQLLPKQLGALYTAGLLTADRDCKYTITLFGRLVLRAFDLGARRYAQLPREPFDDLDQGP